MPTVSPAKYNLRKRAAPVNGIAQNSPAKKIMSSKLPVKLSNAASKLAGRVSPNGKKTRDAPAKARRAKSQYKDVAIADIECLPESLVKVLGGHDIHKLADLKKIESEDEKRGLIETIIKDMNAGLAGKSQIGGNSTNKNDVQAQSKVFPVLAKEMIKGWIRCLVYHANAAGIDADSDITYTSWKQFVADPAANKSKSTEAKPLATLARRDLHIQRQSLRHLPSKLTARRPLIGLMAGELRKSRKLLTPAIASGKALQGKVQPALLSSVRERLKHVNAHMNADKLIKHLHGIDAAAAKLA